MQYGPNDVVEPNDDLYAEVASAAAGAPVGRAPAQVAYPLYGVGNASLAPVAGRLAPLKWPAVGFFLGALTMGGAWFYFGHWRPLKKKANARR